jgi:hypothetical protein
MIALDITINRINGLFRDPSGASRALSGLPTGFSYARFLLFCIYRPKDIYRELQEIQDEPVTD